VKFKELLKFVNTKSIVITDIDSVNPEDSRRTCPTHTPNAKTSNSTLINWLPKKRLISDLNNCPEKDKFDTELIRVAYQIKEDDSEYVARSLEEAIINKNKIFFSSTYKLGEVDKLVKDSFTLLKDEDLNKSPYELAPASGEKTDFTFDLMTFNEKETKLNWNVPKYIEEGLVWLVKNEIVE
jgi:hypothetical protein